MNFIRISISSRGYLSENFLKYFSLDLLHPLSSIPPEFFLLDLVDFHGDDFGFPLSLRNAKAFLKRIDNCSIGELYNYNRG